MDAPKLEFPDKSIAETVRSEATPQQLVAVFQKVIAGSFKQERQRGERAVFSDRELRRRTEICWKWFRIMRHECGYTVDRAFDFLPIALRKELDGVPWEPPSKNSPWGPEALANAVG